MTSPSGIRLDFATILSTSIECTLYGISLVMCGGTMWVLVHGRPRHEINRPMVLVSITLTILSTIHMTVDVQRLRDGFITEGDTFPGGPTGFFADVTQRTFLIKTAVYVLQVLLGDAVVIYRCHIVLQCLRATMLPVVLWCLAFAASIGFFYHVSHITIPVDYFQLNVGGWVIGFYVLSVTANLLGSALLAYRIWMTDRDEPEVVRVLPRSSVEAKLLLCVLVDAALIYSFTLLALLVCYAYQNTAQFIVLDMMTPIISITFSMVLVRIGIAKYDSASVSPSELSPLRFAVRTLPSPSEPTRAGGRRSSI